ncbi:hypothetical protein V1478_005698 [Vespula squamosa]|uniref:Uncharacterized protein n=1 Tax=Vespula squamosa TaxID=30214 RepID=A0ABD2BA24_VESSQ
MWRKKNGEVGGGFFVGSGMFQVLNVAPSEIRRIRSTTQTVPQKDCTSFATLRDNFVELALQVETVRVLLL